MLYVPSTLKRYLHGYRPSKYLWRHHEHQIKIYRVINKLFSVALSVENCYVADGRLLTGGGGGGLSKNTEIKNIWCYEINTWENL